jgi:hypothetical protein
MKSGSIEHFFYGIPPSKVNVEYLGRSVVRQRTTFFSSFFRVLQSAILVNILPVSLAHEHLSISLDDAIFILDIMQFMINHHIP